MEPSIIQIVKRFGRVGGMETYVWNLAHGLARNGRHVFVVCEQVFEKPGLGINVIAVEKSIERARWKSMTQFRNRVDTKIREVFDGQTVLIHSHERSTCHHVSTFHGAPIDSRLPVWLSRFNSRINAWRNMEREELVPGHVQAILSVSKQIQSRLCECYPSIMNKTLDIAWPGITPMDYINNLSSDNAPTGVNFLFVGKEWKRKGLDIAVSIVNEFRKTDPGATLDVFGVARDELPNSITRFPWVTINGWTANIPWRQFRVLLHPARNEPFGMVVAEARNSGVPVVISSRVGASDLDFSLMRVVELDAPLATWVAAIINVTGRATAFAEQRWTWDDLVNKHIEVIYPQIILSPH